jgi:hypothetical protein
MKNKINLEDHFENQGSWLILRTSQTYYKLRIPNWKIQNLKCSTIQVFLSINMVSQVGNPTLDLMDKVTVKMQVHSKYCIKLPSGRVCVCVCVCVCVYGICETYMDFLFRLGSHPQYISLCLCKYSQIQKSQSLKHFWSQAFHIRDAQPVHSKFSMPLLFL